MKVNPDIFKSYDIRGIYGLDFNEEFAFGLGQALVKFLNGGKIAISRDLRASSVVLKEQFIEGVRSSGTDILDLGVTSTPLFYWAAQKVGAQGGVMVTASHLPESFNGFKIVGERGVNIGLSNGLQEIKQFIDQGQNTSPVNSGGQIEAVADLAEQYAEEVIGLSKVKPGVIKIKFGVEANELISRELAIVLAKLGLEPVSSGHDLLFTFDPDGDRLIVYDTKHQKIRGDLIMGLLAKEKIGFFYKPTVVYDFRSSRGVADDLRRSGLKLFRAPVGHTLIKKIMREQRADFAGELSGHLFFKEMGYAESSYLAMLKILRLLQKFNTDINALVKPFETWAHSDEINIETRDKKQVTSILQKLKEKYKDGKIEEFDGVTVEYSDWWFNIRPSNTEAVLRLVVEAKTKEQMEQKVTEISDMINPA